MATEVGAAYVRLLPSMRGFTGEAAKGLKQSLSGPAAEAGEEAGEEGGGGFASKFGEKVKGMAGKLGRVLGGMAKGLGALGGVAAGAIGALGVKRLVGLENANQSLKQMGLGTKEIDGLMSSLLTTLRGTAFGLADGAQYMAALVSAGAPLKKVNKYMDLMADSAAFAQKPLGEIGVTFQKIQSQTKVQGDEIMSLAEKGLPAFQILSKGAGKSVAEIQKTIKEGKFTAEMFFDAWEKGSKGFGAQNIKIEGAAKKMGDTTEGALANMKAAAGRLGAAVLGKPFASARSFFNMITSGLDGITAKVKPWADKFWNAVDIGKSKLKPIVLDIKTKAEDIVSGIDWDGIGNGIKEKAKGIGGFFSDGWSEAVKTQDWGSFGSNLGQGLGQAINSMTLTGVDWAKKFADFVGQVDWFNVGIQAGKKAIVFAFGFLGGLLDGLFSDLPKAMWENKMKTIVILLTLFPIGKAFSLAGKLLGKVPLLGRLFGPLLGGLGKGMQTVGKPFAKLGMAILKPIGTGFKQAFPRLSSFVVGVFTRLPRELMSRYAGFLMYGRGVVTRIIGAIASRYATIVSTGARLIFKLIAGIAKGAVKIPARMLWVHKKIVAGLAGALTILYSAGVDIVQGFINGIIDKAKDLPGVVKDKLVNAPKNIITGVGGWLIRSPSKVAEKYGQYITAGFIRGLNDDKDGIKSSLEEMFDQLALDKKAGKLSKKAYNSLKKYRDKLLAKAAKRDKVLEELDTAKEKYTELKDAAKAFRDSVRDSFKETANVTGYEVNNFTELVGYLSLAQKNAKRFTTVMTALESKGLKKQVIEDILAKGPEEGLRIAEMILGAGKAGIDQVNGLVSGINKQGDTLAWNLSHAFHDAGIEAAKGLIEGLKKKNKELTAVIKGLAQDLADELKRIWKIKSPSRVFADIGEMVPAGMTQGILRGTPETQATLRRLIMSPQNYSSFTDALPAYAGIGLSNVQNWNSATSMDSAAKVLISADGLNRKLLEWLREAIRIEGGSVQKVLGTGNG